MGPLDLHGGLDIAVLKDVQHTVVLQGCGRIPVHAVHADAAVDVQDAVVDKLRTAALEVDKAADVQCPVVHKAAALHGNRAVQVHFRRGICLRNGQAAALIDDQADVGGYVNTDVGAESNADALKAEV